MPRPGPIAVVCALVATACLLRPPEVLASTVKDHLYGVKALGEREAWAVGNFGAIYHTVDAGKTWSPADSRTRNPLFSIDLVGAKGWVVGKSALILHTADGGASWKQQKAAISEEKPLFKVAAIDENTVWAVGDWGAITVTRDGGAHWEDRSLKEDAVLYDIKFLDAQHGAICGEFGTVLTTNDGGTTWQKRNTGTEKTLFGVHFSTPEKGWAVGLDGLLIRTVDGGETWTVQHGQTGSGGLDDLGFMDALRNPGFYEVRVVGEHGVVVGDTGTLLVTTDGGESWKRYELPTKERLAWIRDVSFSNGSHGVAVGASGLSINIDGDTVALPNGIKANPEAAP